MNDDIFSGKGIEIKLKDDDSFLKVKETLTRIGVASKNTKTLYQSCHILHKKGRYIILHFKEMFELDGKPTNTTDNDLARRNTIAKLLSEWELVSLVDSFDDQDEFVPVNQLKIISYKDKNDWSLISKYQIGKPKK